LSGEQKNMQPSSLSHTPHSLLQVAQVISCFAMGSELVRAAALLFTRAVDLEDSIDVLTAAMQVGL
jgi:hypothetical protein